MPVFNAGMFDAQLLFKELTFLLSRSQGPGGQHVNKTETKVTVVWNLPDTQVLTPEAKRGLLEKANRYLESTGIIRFSDSSTRSQAKNKQLAVAKLMQWLTQQLTPQKQRLPTGLTIQVKQRRQQEKKISSAKKKNRSFHWKKEI